MGPGATRSTASAALEAVLASILTLTAGGERLRITRFGTFELRHTPARTGYDIARGSMATRPARTRLHFSPARAFPRRQV